MTIKTGTRLVMAAIAILQSAAVLAEDIDEIVVTADFRNRAVADLPASVTIFDGDDIEQRAIQHFEELIDAVPNLNWSGDGHRARYFQIRGAGELEQYQGAPNPSVGFLIDDIDFSGIGGAATLFDMQQVEVLRGPQGTRYGANALAGLIYMQSTLPGVEWSGRASLTMADDDARAAGVALGGALSGDGRVLMRASLHRHISNGFRDNAFLGRDDSNARDETTARVRLAWNAADHWRVDLAALHADLDNGYDAFAIDNSRTTLSDRPGTDSQRSSGASLKTRYSGWTDVELIAISSIASSDIVFSYDADWGNADSWAPFTYDYISSSVRERRTASQEFRFVAADWLAGVYLLQLDDELEMRSKGNYYDPFFDYADSLDSTFGSDYTATNLAVFGQYVFEFAAGTQLSAGLRAERRDSHYRDSDALRESPSESMWGGELTLQHTHAPSLASYVTLSRGYKAGGFNLGAVPDERREFGDEVMWNVEAGIKSSWDDSRLDLNVALFYARRDHQQVRTSFQLDPNDPASFVFFTDNAAQGRTFGLEADLRWAASDTWEFYAAVGLLHATFERFITPQVNLDGREQAHAPDYNLSIGGRYTHPSGLFARLDLTARDEFYFDVSHDQRSKAYELAHLRVGYDAQRWSLQGWVRNLFDTDYAVRGFYFGNEPPDFPDTLYTRSGDPRQVGASFELRF